MALPSGDGRGAGDLISVDTNALVVTASTFRQSGQDVNALLQSVTGSMQMATGNMLLLLEFAKMVSMLEQLQERIGEAMQCASGGLQRMSTTLEIVSGLFIDSEAIADDAFTHLEDDMMPWKLNFIQFPGVNIGGSPPQVVPTPVPQSPGGILNPLNPLNPLDPTLKPIHVAGGILDPNLY